MAHEAARFVHVSNIHHAPLGTHAPAFALPDVDNRQVRKLEDFSASPALLVVFMCAHCPYVHHVAPELVRLERDYAPRGVAMVGITANDISQYPDDAPEPTARWARGAGLSFPIFFDESQEVAKAFTAACTPDFFLFGPDRKLAYRGQLDSSRPSRGADRPARGELNGGDLRAALDMVLAGKPASAEQKPSIGCNIKWKSGNEPPFFR
jgi:peroxiredoxin